MNTQDALEVVAFMLNRLTMNKVELFSVNAALQQLKAELDKTKKEIPE